MLNQVKILRVLQLISLLKKAPSKSIKNLAQTLNNTERTVYRYLDLIKELGFDLQKDQHNRFSISGDFENDTNNFTPEEANLLKDLLLSSGNKSKLKDSILKKIYLQSEVAIHANNLLNAHLGKSINSLSEAINLGRQVKIKNYHSSSSSKIHDLIVEPHRFTDNYAFVCAYELESKTNKFYKIERISEVLILDEPFRFGSEHQYTAPDAFGSPKTGNAETFEVELRLKMNAFLLIKEEYPSVIPFLKPDSENNNYHLLKVLVYDPQPVLRFIMGLLEDIEIIGSFEFQEYLLGHIGRLFIMKPEEYSPGDTF